MLNLLKEVEEEVQGQQGNEVCIMASYATIEDVQVRMSREMTESEEELCNTLLEDAKVMIDAYNANASNDAKLVVSCRMVIRVLGDGESLGTPLGASQGSQSALGYTESWTMSSGGSVGELYIAKSEKKLLGVGNSIGSYSPVQEMVRDVL